MNRISPCVIAVAAGMLAASALAEVRTWRTADRVNDWDWTADGNFDTGRPVAGDTVVVPAGTEVVISNAASFALASSLKGIRVTDAKSRVVFAIDEGDEADGAAFNAAICSNVDTPKGSDYTKGEIVKRGTGTLWLALVRDDADVSQQRYAYYTDVIVEAGSVRTPMPQETGGYAYYFGHVSVSNGAAFFTMNSKTDYTIVRGLWGQGTVTNDGGSSRNFRVNGDSLADACVFDGVLAGNVKYTSYGRVMLTGTNSAPLGGFASYYHENKNSRWDLGTKLALTGVVRIGNRGGRSSIGTGDLQTEERGGGILYLGEGETTDKNFTMSYPKQGLSYFDAGASGGVTFLGTVGLSTGKANNGMGLFAMTGSNTAQACVWAGPQGPSLSNCVSFVKRGTGVWRFADQYANRYNRDRTFWTTLQVDEGTLQFDSIEPAGRLCSLGTATNCATPYLGVRNDAANRCDYAYIVGNGDAGAVFEFTGTNGAYSTDRLMALNGKATLRNNTTRNWRLSGIRPYDAGAKTLVLDAGEETESEVAGIAGSAESPVSVVKTGAGVWTLNGSNTLYGAVAVKAGTLRIRNPAGPYTWYRWSLRGRAGADPYWNGNIYLSEFGLYDATGGCVSAKLKGVRNYHAVRPGEASVARHVPMYNDNVPTAMGNAFDGTASHWEFGTKSVDLKGDNTTALYPDRPETWVPILMRLPASAGAASRYDFMQPYSLASGGNNAKRILGSWQVEGSADGIHWDLLSSVTTNAAGFAASRWAGDPASGSFALPHVGGFGLARTASAVPTTVFDHVTGVSVAAGATLEAVGDVRLTKLNLVGANNGTVRGFSFADSGTLSLTGVRKGRTSVPVKFEDCRDSDKLANWSVTIDGRPCPGVTASVGADGSLELSRPGFMLVVRGESLKLEPGRTDVVIGAKAAPTVRFAAAELTNFLSRALGESVPVRTQRTPGRMAVVLGENDWSRAAGLDPTPLERDGFLRFADGDTVYLVGRDDPKEDPARMAKGQGSTMFERATLFAVYDFLERFAGCRFFFPGELGTVVPEGVSVTVPCGLAKTEPVFTERYYSSHRAGGVWYDKSLTMQEMLSLNNLRMRYGTQRKPCCHGQRQFHYVARFAAEHPDWFCLQADGTRYLVDTEAEPHYRNGKLCYSSPIREEIYRDVKAYLTGEPAASRGLARWGSNCVDGRYVDIMPEDSLMECHCPQCQAAYDKGEEMYATEFIWGLTAEIAARLTREGVKGDVCQMAYSPYRRVPRTELPPNVQVMVAENGPWSSGKPQELNRQLEEIRAWSEKLGHKVWLWTYPGKYGGKYPDCPQISPRAYAKFFRAAAPWICGGYIEIDTDRFAYDVLNVYVYSRLAWNPNLDIEALVADWHDRLFGFGASAMQRAFDRLEEIWMDDVQDVPTVETELGPVTPERSYPELCTRAYSPERVAEIAALFDEAAGAVVPGSREARAIAMFRQEIVEPLRIRAENSSVKGELARRASRPDRSILKNGSMDENLDGWRSDISDATVVRDTEEKVEGAASVRLTTSDGADAERYSRAAISQSFPLEEGCAYRLSYFLKAKDVVPYARNEGAGLCLWEGTDYTKHPLPLVTGSCDWIHLQLDFTARADAGRLQFRICDATGTMWIDGVRLEKMD